MHLRSSRSIADQSGSSITIHTHTYRAKARGRRLRLTFHTNHLKTSGAVLFNAAHYFLLAVEDVIAVSVTHFQVEHSPNNSSKSLKNSFYSLPFTFRSLCSPDHFSLYFLPSFHLLTMLEGCSPIMHCSVIKVNHRFVNHGDGGVKWSIHPRQSGALAAAAFYSLVTASHFG